MLLGVAAFAGGSAGLFVGIRLYRRSDHRMRPGEEVGGVIRTRFPLLTPLMAVILLLMTALLAWMVFAEGLDWKNPEAIRMCVGWGVLMVAFVSAVVRRLLWGRRSTDNPRN